MDPVSAKTTLRGELLARRRSRTADERDRVARALAERGRGLCAGASAVAVYESYGSEPGTGPLRAALAAAEVVVLLPVVRGEQLGWAPDDGVAHVRGGELGMPEPAGPLVGLGAAGLLAVGVTVLLVPALAVSRNGVRLGRGGGFYDRLLADLPAYPRGPLRVVVVHDDEVLPELPAEPHDHAARVDRILTPSAELAVTRD